MKNLNMLVALAAIGLSLSGAWADSPAGQQVSPSPKVLPTLTAYKEPQATGASVSEAEATTARLQATVRSLQCQLDAARTSAATTAGLRRALGESRRQLAASQREQERLRHRRPLVVRRTVVIRRPVIRRYVVASAPARASHKGGISAQERAFRQQFGRPSKSQDELQSWVQTGLLPRPAAHSQKAPKPSAPTATTTGAKPAPGGYTMNPWIIVGAIVLIALVALGFEMINRRRPSLGSQLAAGPSVGPQQIRDAEAASMADCLRAAHEGLGGMKRKGNRDMYYRGERSAVRDTVAYESNGKEEEGESEGTSPLDRPFPALGG